MFLAEEKHKAWKLNINVFQYCDVLIEKVAAVAAGVYKDLPEAAQYMVKVKCRIEPITANIPV